jgi:hypothetical protein
MKGCYHDKTIMEDECDCDRPIMHTNSADAGLPHTSLTSHIADLEDRLARIGQINGELVTALSHVGETMHKQPKTHACAVAEAQTKAALIRSLVIF